MTLPRGSDGGVGHTSGVGSTLLGESESILVRLVVGVVGQREERRWASPDGFFLMKRPPPPKNS